MLCFFMSVKIKSKADKLRKDNNIQPGEVAYSDLDVPGTSFFSKKYKITGKPDYVLKRGGRYIPVEVKKGSYSSPQDNHVFQLAAYCQLIEENYCVFVPYGLVAYEDSCYKISFDPNLRFQLQNTIAEMRDFLKRRDKGRNHNDINRCKSCSLRSYCEEKIK